jgi:putative glutamine amidotransferase
VPETEDFPPEPDRDAYELALLEGAYERGLPVLGICRGLQLINVCAGGTLHQDVPPHAAFDQPPETELHEVNFEAGTVVGELYGGPQWVNSLHHQVVDRLGRELLVSGRSGDGAIEALEHMGLPVIAVQWHPEMMRGRAHDPSFGWLVDTAIEFARY